jgi:hypothetical protein
LEEVGELLSLEEGLHCREVEEIAGRKLAAVRERIAQLRTIESALATLIRKCSSNKGKLLWREIGRDWIAMIRKYILRVSTPAGVKPHEDSQGIQAWQ